MTKIKQSKPLVDYTVPKAEMHVHISLALSNEVFLRRIKYDRTPVKPDFLITPKMRYYQTLQNFHETYEAMRNVTNTPQELANTTQDYLERIAKEGAIYAEISNSFRDEKSFEQQMESIQEGIEAARYNTGIEARIIVTAIRDHGAKKAEEIASYLAKNPSPYITGFGLAGSEQCNAFYNFKKALHIAWHDAGLGLTPHVAEQYPKHALDFLDCIPMDALSPHPKDQRRLRVGHGTLIHTSSHLMKEFFERKICMEVCLSANKRIGLPDDVRAIKRNDKITASDTNRTIKLDKQRSDYFGKIENHPLKTFMQEKIPVCLGSDNPLLMNTNIGKEYSLACKSGAVKPDETIQFTKTGLHFANLDAVTRDRLLSQIDLYEERLKKGFKPISTVLGYRRSDAI